MKKFLSVLSLSFCLCLSPTDAVMDRHAQDGLDEFHQIVGYEYVASSVHTFDPYLYETGGFNRLVRSTENAFPDLPINKDLSWDHMKDQLLKEVQRSTPTANDPFYYFSQFISENGNQQPLITGQNAYDRVLSFFEGGTDRGGTWGPINHLACDLGVENPAQQLLSTLLSFCHLIKEGTLEGSSEQALTLEFDQLHDRLVALEHETDDLKAQKEELENRDPEKLQEKIHALEAGFASHLDPALALGQTISLKDLLFTLSPLSAEERAVSSQILESIKLRLDTLTQELPPLRELLAELHNKIVQRGNRRDDGFSALFRGILEASSQEGGLCGPGRMTRLATVYAEVLHMIDDRLKKAEEPQMLHLADDLLNQAEEPPMRPAWFAATNLHSKGTHSGFEVQPVPPQVGQIVSFPDGTERIIVEVNGNVAYIEGESVSLPDQPLQIFTRYPEFVSSIPVKWTDAGWTNGYSNTRSFFFILHCKAAEAQYAPGQILIFPNGEKREIEKYQIEGPFAYIHYKGERLDGRDMPAHTPMSLHRENPFVNLRPVLWTDEGWRFGFLRTEALFFVLNTKGNRDHYIPGTILPWGPEGVSLLVTGWKEEDRFLHVSFEEAPFPRQLPETVFSLYHERGENHSRLSFHSVATNNPIKAEVGDTVVLPDGSERMIMKNDLFENGLPSHTLSGPHLADFPDGTFTLIPHGSASTSIEPPAWTSSIWGNGYHNGGTLFLVSDSAQARAFYKPGQEVIFPDGSSRKISAYHLPPAQVFPFASLVYEGTHLQGNTMPMAPMALPHDSLFVTPGPIHWTDGGWKHGVSKTENKFFVHNTQGNRDYYVPGNMARLHDGRAVRITGNREAGRFLHVTFE